MADATQDIQLTLRGIDEASGPIRDVSAALERLGQLNLSGSINQLDALGRGLDALGSQAQLLGERFDAMSAVVRAAMSTMTADVTAQAAQQRAALQQHGEETLAAVRDTQTAMTGVIAEAVKDQAAALGKGLDTQKSELDAGTKQLVKIVRDAYAQIDQVVDTSFKNTVQKTHDAMAQVNAAVQGTSAQAAALGAVAGGATGATKTPSLAQQYPTLLGDKGLLGEKGPVGGGFELPGVDLAQQFFIWGTVFSLYSKATQGAQQLASALFTSNASFQETRATLSAIYGGSGPAQAALAWLDKFAETTPFTRDETRRAGIAFAAMGDNIKDVLPVAGNLSAAMHNVGGITTGTQAIVDAQNGQFRMLRDQLHVTKEELEQYGLAVNKAGHVTDESTFLPALKALVQARGYAGDPSKGLLSAMDEQMKTLPGVLSNLQDIASEAVRHAGKGMYDALQGALTPIISAMGDATSGHGVGATLMRFADTIGTGMGQALQGGLDALSGWFSHMGGLEGVIARVEQAWLSFTAAVRTGFSVVQGIGDAIGNVVNVVHLAADAISFLLAPVRMLFGALGGGQDTLRQMTSLFVTLGLELKLAATAWGLVQGAAGRFAGILGAETSETAANTAAIEANTAALTGNAAAAGGAAAGGAAAGAARGASATATGMAALEESGAFLGVGGGLAGISGGLLAMSEGFGSLSGAIIGAIGPMGVFIADMILLPNAFSAVTLAIQTLRGIDVKGLQTDLGLGIPKTQYQSQIGAPGTLRDVQTQGPGAFAAFLQNTLGTEAYRDWAEFIGHQRPGDFISYVQRLPQAQMEQVATEYGREGGTGGQKRIEDIARGTAAGLTAAQQSNIYTSFNQAIAATASDVGKYQSQRLVQDVPAQVEAYAAVYRAQHPQQTDKAIGAAIDTYATQVYGQYKVPLPADFGKPKGAAQGPTQDQLDAAAQAAQQIVQWDEAAKVPYQQFKQDMDAATKAMTAAGDPAIQVQAFYRQHTDAWARAAAQVSQQTLQADEAMHAPFSVIQRDMADLATKLKAEGDTSQQVAAKLGQTVETYFQNLISQVSAQQQALATLHAPVGQQLAGVAQGQALMQQENAQLARQGLPPKFSPEEIAAAGVTGTRQVLAPGLQAQATVSKDAYSAALQQNQVTSLGQIAGYVAPIIAAERAQLTNQGTPGAQIAAELQLEQLQLIRQGQDAVLKRAQDQFTFDLNAHASVKALHQDENAALAVIAAESGPGSIQYRLAKQQMDQQIAGGAGAGAARPPEPHYGTYGSLTATGAAYGQSVVTYGTQLAHDPWQQVVAGLREQLAFWKSKAQAEQQQLDALRATASNTARTADAVHRLILPPFTPTGPLSQASLPRVSGAHTPIRRP